jgi:integrase
VDWNLALVLKVLSGSPFEPLRQATKKNRTFKTVFLVALATARRRSEIHAFTIDKIAYAENGTSVTIHTDPNFLSKTSVPSRGTGFPPVIIPALPDGSLEDASEKTLCPVRAIKIYTEIVEKERKGRRKLFISHDSRHTTEIATATVSSWIRQAVCLCYQLSNNHIRNEFNITAHSVRGWATSWAVTNRASINDVMTAASWHSHSTLTRHYLRDVTNISDDMLRIGPVVTALTIT